MEPVSIEKVHEAARDINQILGLKPQIETSWPERRIHDALKSVGDLVDVTDELQENTWDVLITLGFLKPSVEQEFQAKHPEYQIASETEIVSKISNGEITTVASEKSVTERVSEKKNHKSDALSKPVTGTKAGLTRGKREYAGLVERLVGEGLHTQRDVVNAVLREYPALKADSVRTFVSDSKNAKYTTLQRKVITDSDGRLRFEE